VFLDQCNQTIIVGFGAVINQALGTLHLSTFL
jgi:hypothetical protein